MEASSSQDELAAKNAEIVRLKRENDELLEKLKKFEQENGEADLQGNEVELPEDLLNCPVCCFNFSKKQSRIPMVGSCGHTVCSQCSKLLPNRHCPVCRAMGSFRKPSKNFLACDFLQQSHLLIRTSIKSHGNTILLIGGTRSDNVYNTVLVLSLDRSEWIELELELPYKVYGSGAVYLNGEIYLFGGYDNPQALYKLDKNMNWTRLADMNIGRLWISNSCLEYNGYIWVFGGSALYGSCLKSVERYDPKTDKWTLMPDMNHCRSSAAATIWKNKIVISGGLMETHKNGMQLTDVVEYFNPEKDCWMELEKMPRALCFHSLVSCNEILIILGGYMGATGCDDVWEFDNHKEYPGWRLLPRMKYTSHSFAGRVLDKEIYVIGGYGGLVKTGLEDLNRVEIFDGEGWRDGPSLPCPIRDMPAVIIPQNLANRLCSKKW